MTRRAHPHLLDPQREPRHFRQMLRPSELIETPALASDLAGDPLQDLLPLPDPELNPDELDELEQLPLDPHPDAELPLEEVPDCDCCGEGDLACLCLEGECTGRRGASRKTSRGNCLGVFRDVDGCCGGRGSENNPRFTDWPASSTADDGILQNVLGLSAAIKGWSMREIQVVKPQPGLCVSQAGENPQVRGD